MSIIVESVHELIVGDTQDPIGATLKENGSARDLSGATVQFKMIDASSGEVVVDWASATVVSASAGTVQYTFQSADVANAGVFYAWFRTVVGGAYRTWPVGAVSPASDTQPARVFKVVIREAA